MFLGGAWILVVKLTDEILIGNSWNIIIFSMLQIRVKTIISVNCLLLMLEGSIRLFYKKTLSRCDFLVCIFI